MHEPWYLYVHTHHTKCSCIFLLVSKKGTCEAKRIDKGDGEKTKTKTEHKQNFVFSVSC